MENRYALVLAGGGAKGIYQIGVWKALRELGICYDVVVGSSIGAVNGALMAQNDWDSAFELWRAVTLEKILELPPDAGVKDFLIGVVKNFGVSAAPLKRLLERHIDEKKIRTSGIRYGLTTFNLSRLRQEELFIEEIPEGELIPYLLAATAFPGIKTQPLHGKRCMDGGFTENGAWTAVLPTISPSGLSATADTKTSLPSIFPDWDGTKRPITKASI